MTINTRSLVSASVTETCSQAVLLVNLATVHNPALSSAVGLRLMTLAWNVGRFGGIADWPQRRPRFGFGHSIESRSNIIHPHVQQSCTPTIRLVRRKAVGHEPRSALAGRYWSNLRVPNHGAAARVSFSCHMRHWDDIQNENATFEMRIDKKTVDSQSPCHLAKRCSLGNLHVLCTVAPGSIRCLCTTWSLGLMRTMPTRPAGPSNI